jgi:hypothetical protein
MADNFNFIFGIWSFGLLVLRAGGRVKNQPGEEN